MSKYKDALKERKGSGEEGVRARNVTGEKEVEG